jgi:hypothetical protein
MEEVLYQLLAFGDPPESHYLYQWDKNPHSIGGHSKPKSILKSYYASSSHSQLYVTCNNLTKGGLAFITLSFHDENLTELFTNRTESTITFHLPTAHFAGIYAMLQDAFTNQKNTVMLKLFGKDSLWTVKLDFNPNKP